MGNKPPIGLDLRMWAHPGIGRYMRELFSTMFRLQDPDRFTYLAYPDDEVSVRSALKGGRLVRAQSSIYSLAEQKELSNFSRKVSLLHVPHFNAPLFCRSRLVVTLHDLIYLKEKRFSGSALANLYVRTLIGGIQRNARGVIAVSDFTRRDLEKSFPKLTGKVTVIHEAASDRFSAKGTPADAELPKELGLRGEYILFVGSLKAHKNLPALLDAFESLRRAGNVFTQLAVVGRKDAKETALLDRLDRSRAFVSYLGEQPDEALAALYRGARALVIPSLWEGFGLTAVEAMACGTPVICSNRASLPEVVGKAGLMFDPERPEELAEHLSRVLKDEGFRNSLSRGCLEQAGLFSWEKTALETWALYQKAMA